MHDEELLQRLPPSVAVPLRSALEAHARAAAPAPLFAPDAYPGLRITASPPGPAAYEPLLTQALDDAGWPRAEAPIPRAESLSPTHRALAELLATRAGLPLFRFAMPQSAWARRRWLGLATPGPLEREVSYVAQGEPRRAPLWAALRELDDAEEESAKSALLEALPLGERLAALCELETNAWRVEARWPEDYALLEGDDAAWAPTLARRLSECFAPGAPASERGHRSEPSWSARWWTFLALAQWHERTGEPLEAAWDWLLPVARGVMEASTRRCLAALPPERRGPALAGALRRAFSSEAVRGALHFLPEAPHAEVLSALWEAAEDTVGCLDAMPRRVVLARARALLEAHPALLARLEAWAQTLPPPSGLRLRSSVEPTRLGELTALQRAQLEATSGVGNAGLDASAGRVEAPGPDAALAYVTLDALEGPDGALLYESSLFMHEDGVFFRAGTTEPVAWLCQYRLEGDDAALLEALQEALWGR